MFGTTYNPPSAKTRARATLCGVANFREYITGIGSASMRISVAMENPALANQFFVILIHVPFTDLSHARGIANVVSPHNTGFQIVQSTYDDTARSQLQLKQYHS